MVNQTVLVGTAVTVLAAEATLIVKGEPSLRPVIGGFLAGTFLFAIDTFAPTVASALAILMMVSSILINGDALFASVRKALG